MLFSNKKHVSTCQKTSNPIKQTSKFLLLKLLCPITGLLALAWFLIRVIPKPSRATYPCQRVAFPLASSFIIWLLGMAGSAAAYHRAKRSLAQARYIMAAVCIFASVAFIWMAMSSDRQEPASAHEPIVNNAPMGEGKGINPGRVAWIHDSNAAKWTGANGVTTPPYWQDPNYTNPEVVASMLSKALRAMTGEVTDRAAWDAIFRNFNQQIGRGDVNYTPGQKIGIKVNFVTMNDVNNSGTKATAMMDNIDNSPELAIALLQQLTNVAGVSPGNISIGDPTQCMPDYWYNMVNFACPGVVYVIKRNVTLSGRTQVIPDYNAPFYWSDPCASHFSGVTNQDYIPTCFSQANYFINFATLKSHNGAGITLGGKNHFGSLMRKPPPSASPGYYDMHWSRLGTALPESPGMNRYRAVVDLLSHPKLGGNTMLTLIDGLYSGRSWDAQPIRWNMAPFDGNWPCSIFLSQDRVAIDSVCFDFMDNEWNAASNNINGYPQMSGADDYLHEAALIPDPCSGVNYDPNHDGGITESLGVHEHWNDANNKQYSRNLGTGEGIELVKYAPGWPDISGDGFVNFEDFAIMANAWRSTTGSANYDANCDISSNPGDGVIDEKDLAVLFENWLADFTSELVRPGAVLQEAYSVNGINFEGPTWDPASDKLFFTRRTGTYQILKLDGPNTVYPWLTPSPQTNGTIMSNDGRLLACDESPMQISSRRIDPCGPGDTIILADTSDGFTRPPNDLCQLVNGKIYFTTPKWDSSTPAQQGVWLLEPNGAVRQVDGSLYQPNGIITSLDETKLYVSAGSTTTANQKWQVFDIDPNGNLSNAAVFFNPSGGIRSNVPDGMTIDERGNLYFTGLGGVWIVSPAGELLKFISLPFPPFNACFGGPDGRTLYMTCQYKVYSLQMAVRGGEATSW